MLILLRWRQGTNAWEGSLYAFPSGLGSGMILSTQFIGLSTSAPKDQLATSISIYYLSQQVGTIVGISVTAAVLRGAFQNTLMRELGDVPGKAEVSELATI